MEMVAIIGYQTWLDFFQFAVEEVLWLDRQWLDSA